MSSSISPSDTYTPIIVMNTRPLCTRFTKSAISSAATTPMPTVRVRREGLRSLPERKRTRLTISAESTATSTASAASPRSAYSPPSWWFTSTSAISTDAAAGTGRPMKYLPGFLCSADSAIASTLKRASRSAAHATKRNATNTPR